MCNFSYVSENAFHNSSTTLQCIQPDWISVLGIASLRITLSEHVLSDIKIEILNKIKDILGEEIMNFKFRFKQQQ